MYYDRRSLVDTMNQTTVWTIRRSNPGRSKRFSSTTNVKTGSGAHSTSYSICTGVLSLGVKRPVRDVDHSPPSGAEFMDK
jgi:hypothetical protein